MDATRGAITLGAVVSSLIFYNALLPNETKPEVLPPPPAHVDFIDDFLGGIATVQETKTPALYIETRTPSTSPGGQVQIPKEFGARTMFIFDKLMNDPRNANLRLQIEVFSFVLTVVVFFLLTSCFKKKKTELPTDYNELMKQIEEKKNELQRMEKRSKIVENIMKNQESVEKRRADLADIRRKNAELEERIKNQPESAPNSEPSTPDHTPQRDSGPNHMDEDYFEDDIIIHEDIPNHKPY